MKVIHWGKAKRFYQQYRFAEAPLKRWKLAVQSKNWNSFSEVRQSFSSADWIDGTIVFNISGNHYRLLAKARFQDQKIYISQVMTHEEYSKKNWKK